MFTVSRAATRKIAVLKEQLTACKVYTLGNGFIGNPVDPKHAWEALSSNQHARLWDNENGTFTVNVHSNRWYELRKGE